MVRDRCITMIINNLNQMKPKYDKYIPIFRHCSQNREYVYKGYWDSHIWPILRGHGFVEFHIVKETDK